LAQIRLFQRSFAGALDRRKRRFHRPANGVEDMTTRIASLLLGAAIVVLSATLSSAGPLERLITGYHGYLPPCDSSWALGTISLRFGYKEARFWNSSESLAQFGDVHEIAYRPWGPNFVPRRYCSVKVRLASLRDTTVYYSIIEKGGFAGAGYGVEWCVVGYDRNLAYAPNCRAARP
jgi:hypothetical protein